jgi:hypothetical protein
MNTEITQAHRADSLKARYSSMDRRKSVRVYGSFPIHMRGVDEFGCGFDANTLVDNISGGGLYMQLARPVGEGSKLFAAVQLSNGVTITARGFAIRVEKRPFGLTGVAMRFTRTRLFPRQNSTTPWPPVSSGN